MLNHFFEKVNNKVVRRFQNYWQSIPSMPKAELHEELHRLVLLPSGLRATYPTYNYEAIWSKVAQKHSNSLQGVRSITSFNIELILKDFNECLVSLVFKSYQDTIAMMKDAYEFAPEVVSSKLVAENNPKPEAENDSQNNQENLIRVPDSDYLAVIKRLKDFFYKTEHAKLENILEYGTPPAETIFSTNSVKIISRVFYILWVNNALLNVRDVTHLNQWIASHFGYSKSTKRGKCAISTIRAINKFNSPSAESGDPIKIVRVEGKLQIS